MEPHEVTVSFLVQGPCHGLWMKIPQSALRMNTLSL